MNPLHLINDFIEKYAASLEMFNAKLIMSFYELPCTFISGENNTVYTDALLLEAFLTQGTSFYKTNGILYSRPEVWTKQHLSDTMAMVKVKWKYYDADNIFQYACDYQYLLRWIDNKEWKIAVAISLNEYQQLAAWKQQ